MSATAAAMMLTEQDHAFLKEHGYLRVPGVVSRDNAAAVVDAMFEFLGFDRNNPADWYRPPLRENNGGMVEMYHHQSMWDNRQHPRVYQVFRELLGETKLHVTLDRVSFKVPDISKTFTEAGFLHLDVDLRGKFERNPPLRLQGLISLTDTTEDQGGFHCVPGFHHRCRAWALLPDDRRPAEMPDFSKIIPTPIPAQAGDLIVWDIFLPHGSGRNRTPRPRMAQYLSMAPADKHDADAVAERVRRWRGRLPTFSGDPRKIEEANSEPAHLTPLGRKLLGLDAWE